MDKKKILKILESTLIPGTVTSATSLAAVVSDAQHRTEMYQRYSSTAAFIESLDDQQLAEAIELLEGRTAEDQTNEVQKPITRI